MLFSAASIGCCCKRMGLKGSGLTTQETPDVVKRQLVLDEMAKDPNRKHGPRIVKENIARTKGMHLTRHVFFICSSKFT